jgi:hypothetical protein
MIGFLGIRSVHAPLPLVLEVQTHLRSMGERGLEGFALWAGLAEGNTFIVRHTVIPAQTGLITDTGVCVTVDGKELHRINVWLFRHGLTLIAQLHSHPTEAYHSETDDMFPIVTTVGGLSLVIPDFASRPFSLEDCAVYRLTAKRGWVLLPTNDVLNLIRIIE